MTSIKTLSTVLQLPERTIANYAANLIQAMVDETSPKHVANLLAKEFTEETFNTRQSEFIKVFDYITEIGWCRDVKHEFLKSGISERLVSGTGARNHLWSYLRKKGITGMTFTVEYPSGEKVRQRFFVSNLKSLFQSMIDGGIVLSEGPHLKVFNRMLQISKRQNRTPLMSLVSTVSGI